MGDIDSADRNRLYSILFDEMGLTKGRLLGFCDAVIAIAITLLALEIRLPELPETEMNTALIDALAGVFPNILSFIISFFVIASFWLSLHRIYYLVEKLDRIFIWLTLVFLFFIALMPFPTSAIGRYGSEPAALMFYAVMIIMVSAVAHLMWRYASGRRRLISTALDPNIVKLIGRRSLYTMIIFAVSIPVAMISPLLAELFWIIGIISLVTFLRWTGGSLDKR